MWSGILCTLLKFERIDSLYSQLLEIKKFHISKLHKFHKIFKYNQI